MQNNTITCDVCAKPVEHSLVLIKTLNGQRMDIKIDVCEDCKKAYFNALVKEFAKEVRRTIKKNTE